MRTLDLKHMLSPRRTKSIKRPTVEGFMSIQLNSQWANCQARVDGPLRCLTFIYVDKRCLVDLKTAIIKRGKRNRTGHYIYIESEEMLGSMPSKYIRISSQDSHTLNQWMRAIMVASMTDE